MSVHELRGAAQRPVDARTDVYEAATALRLGVLEPGVHRADDLSSVGVLASPQLPAELPADAARPMGGTDRQLLGRSAIDSSQAPSSGLRLLTHVDAGTPDGSRAELLQACLRAAAYLRTELPS
ncbi:MAG: chorismate mutase [Mycobacteriales bacterium]